MKLFLNNFILVLDITLEIKQPGTWNLVRKIINISTNVQN